MGLKVAEAGLPQPMDVAMRQCVSWRKGVLYQKLFNSPLLCGIGSRKEAGSFQLLDLWLDRCLCRPTADRTHPPYY